MPRQIASFAAGVVLGLCALVSAADGQTPVPSQSAPVQPGNADNGRQLFAKYGCYECHGFEGQGGSPAGPRLAPNPLPLAALITYIRQPRQQMPPYTAKVLSDEDAADIHAFLRTRSQPARIEMLK